METIEKPQGLITIEQRRDLILDEITNLQVTNQAEYEVSSDIETKLKGLIKESEELRTEEVGPLNEQVKRINNLFREAQQPVQIALNNISDKNSKYQRDQLLKQRQEQAKAAEIARLEFERKQEQERAAREAQERLQREAAEAAERQRIATEKAEKAKRDAEAAAEAGENDLLDIFNVEAANAAQAAADAEFEFVQAGYEAQQAAQKADAVAPMIPEPVVPIVSTFTKSVKTDAGTNTTKTFWNWKYASNTDTQPETTRIDKRFMIIVEGKIKAFVKGGFWTKKTEVAPGYWTIEECQGIIVFEDVANVSRSAR